MIIVEYLDREERTCYGELKGQRLRGRDAGKYIVRPLTNKRRKIKLDRKELLGVRLATDAEEEALKEE